jgi:two-component system response regulator DegU
MIKVLLVDDSSLFKEALKKVFNVLPTLLIVGECEDGIEVIPFLKRNEVDVIFMDYEMKHQNGAVTTREVKENYPEIKIIGLSIIDEEFVKQEFLKSGADDFIVKHEFSIDKIARKINYYEN